MRKLRLWLPLLLALAMVIGLSPEQSRAQDGLPYYEVNDCPFDALPEHVEGQTYECGTLYVPEDRSNPDGNQVLLAVVHIFSDNPNPLPDPIIYLEGGPGGSAIAGMDAWIGTPFSANRDIIVFDQRGTGWSQPSLDCPEMQEDVEDPERDCYDRLVSEGVNLASYNSRENAADVADLRVSMGYDEVNLYGISYGTRLALTVLRDHPEGIRSVVIDGVYPPQVKGFSDQPRYGQRSFDQLFSDCAADPACDAAYPDLADRLYALVDALNAQPASYETDDGETEVTGDDLVNAMFQAFYNTAGLPYLPLGISLLEQGYADLGMAVINGELNGETLLAMADGTMEEGDQPAGDPDAFYFYDIDSDSEGMYESVQCNEEAPYDSVEASLAGVDDVAPQFAEALVYSLEGQLAVCDYWDSGIGDPVEDQAVVSDVPTLVFSGNYDPVTPPDWGDLAASTLSNGQAFEFPGVGHGSVDGGDCPVSIALAFIDNPSTPLDASCIAGMSIQFFTEEIPLDALGEGGGGGAVSGGAPGQSGDLDAEVQSLLADYGWTMQEFEDELAFNDLTYDDILDMLDSGEMTLDDLEAFLSE